MINNQQKRTDKDFIADLRQELMATQEARLKLTLRKLIFITGLLALGGSLEYTGSNQLDSLNPILLAPIVAILFDLYVEGENFGIRRIGIFIKHLEGTPDSERFWETILNERSQVKYKIFSLYTYRDLFSILANPFATIIVCGISIFYSFCELDLSGWFRFGYISFLVLMFSIWCFFKSVTMKKRINRFEEKVIDSNYFFRS